MTFAINGKPVETSDYDDIADILYLWVGEPRPAITYETTQGHLVQLDPESREFLGVAILDYKATWEGQTITIDVPVRTCREEGGGLTEKTKDAEARPTPRPYDPSKYAVEKAIKRSKEHGRTWDSDLTDIPLPQRMSAARQAARDCHTPREVHELMVAAIWPSETTYFISAEAAVAPIMFTHTTANAQ